MKTLKAIVIILGSVPALLLLAGNVGATTLTSPTGTAATPAIEAESEGHATLDHLLTKVACQWTLKGKVTEHGVFRSAVIKLTELETTGCTNGWHVTTSLPGELKISSTGGYNGTVVWSGSTVATTHLGVTCNYATGNTHLGTITGGSPATIHLDAVYGLHNGSAMCGESVPLTGSISVTAPTSLYIDE